MDDIVDRSCLIGYKVRNYTTWVFGDYELTHSKETYQPRMRWDRNMFYDSHGDGTPPKAVETSKVGHRSFLEAEYQAKTDVKPTKHGVLEPLPGGTLDDSF